MSASSIYAGVKRWIGIRHRVKQTAKNEARPTQVVILTPDGGVTQHELENEQHELDFVLGVYPTGYRKVVDGEDVSGFREHHIKREEDGRPAQVPSGFEGLKADDMVSMTMGGSGDYLAYALTRRSKTLGGSTAVVRIPPFVLKQKRGDGVMADDAKLLAELCKNAPELFTPVHLKDLAIVRVREQQRLRIDAMKSRIGCEQRVRQMFIGRIFCSVSGQFPEGAIEKEFDALKASDLILTNLRKEEARIIRELEKAVEDTEVWQKVLSNVEGCGVAIAARLISVIQDVRRFETAPKLRKYLGVHVQEDGRFPRRRAGELAGWSNEGRQALYLLIDQMNRRPDSVWGQKFLANKAFYAEKYPHPELLFEHDGRYRTIALVPGSFSKKGTKYEIVVDDQLITVSGKMRHFKGHLHKMAGWRTASQFVDWLFTEWWKLEGGKTASVPKSDTKQESGGEQTSVAA